MRFIIGRNKFVLIGLLISILGLLYNFYRGYTSSRTEEISFLTNKVESIKKELSIPLVDVNVFSASDILSDDMISKLSLIPSSVEIRHLKGETAQKITVDISCAVPIKKFSKESSVETFNVSYLDDTFKVIRINIPELRKSAEVKIILLTAKPPTFKINFFADKGEIFDFEKEAGVRTNEIERLRKEIGFVELWPLEEKSFDYNPVIVSGAVTTRELQIKLIEARIKQLRDDNIVKALIRFLIANPYLILAVLATLIIVGFIAEKSNNEKNYKKLLDKIKMGKFEIGESLVSVINKIDCNREFVGFYDPAIVHYDLILGYVTFKYLVSDKNIGKISRIFFKFRNSVLIEIEDTYQGEIILNSSSLEKSVNTT